MDGGERAGLAGAVSPRSRGTESQRVTFVDPQQASGARRTRPDFVVPSTPAESERLTVSAEPAQSTSRQRNARSSPRRSPL